MIKTLILFSKYFFWVKHTFKNICDSIICVWLYDLASSWDTALIWFETDKFRGHVTASESEKKSKPIVEQFANKYNKQAKGKPYNRNKI